LGTRFGFGFASGAGLPPFPVAGLVFTPLFADVPVALLAAGTPEPCAIWLVVEVGPAPLPVVSDVVTACVVELDVLLFAADADFVPPPLHAAAAAAIAIEKRIERFIFRG
jgi:hypothetical protein